MKRVTWMTLAIGWVVANAATGVIAAPTTAAGNSGSKVGVYDSRAIAYAHFWSDAHQKEINGLMESAKAAKASGQEDRFKELDAALKAEQERNHLRVFSTAPVDDVLKVMGEQVTTIRKDCGVTQLISKWDKQELKRWTKEQRVEVTDRILREFKLSDKQMKVVEDLRKKAPLPMAEAEKLLREGKL